MTMARSKLVDTSVTKWYHCISRCVQRAFLLAEGSLDRKQWIGQSEKDRRATVWWHRESLTRRRATGSFEPPGDDPEAPAEEI
jgi:hypothetical protein